MFFRIVYFARIILFFPECLLTGMFFGRVILLGSFFEKQVIGMETGKEFINMFIQTGTENDEKLKSRPGNGLGSDALSGTPRMRLTPVICSDF